MPYGTLALDTISTSGNLAITGNVIVSGTVSGPVSTITGNITLTSASMGTTYVCSGTSVNYAVTLPSTTGLAGKTVTFVMSSALTKLVTITAAGGNTIDGSATRIMWAGESATLLTDGTNWYKVSGKTVPMVAGQYKTGADQSIPNNSATKLTLGTAIASNCPAAMNDTANSRIVIVRPSVYHTVAAARFKNVSAAGNYEVLGYKNGAEITIVSRYMTSGDWGPVEAIYPLSLVVNDYVETYARQYSGSAQNTFDNNGNGLYLTEIPQW